MQDFHWLGQHIVMAVPNKCENFLTSVILRWKSLYYNTDKLHLQRLRNLNRFQEIVERISDCCWEPLSNSCWTSQLIYWQHKNGNQKKCLPPEANQRINTRIFWLHDFYCHYVKIRRFQELIEIVVRFLLLFCWTPWIIQNIHALQYWPNIHYCHQKTSSRLTNSLCYKRLHHGKLCRLSSSYLSQVLCSNKEKPENPLFLR